MSKTQREIARIIKYQRDAFVTYLEFLVAQNEVPREELVLTISGCTDIDKLKATIAIMQKKGKPTPSQVGNKNQ